MADEPDFGIDISTYPDLDPSFTLINGWKALGEALARRYETHVLFYDDQYGYDLRSLLYSSLFPGDLASIQRAIEAQALLDQRILAADALVIFNGTPGGPGDFRAVLTCTTTAGPYTLTLFVNQVTVRILNPNG